MAEVCGPNISRLVLVLLLFRIIIIVIVITIKALVTVVSRQ